MSAKFPRTKKLVVSVLCSKLSGRLIALATGNRIPFRNARIDVRDAPVTDNTKARLFFGIYESAECRFVNKYLHPDLETIELGASLGAVSSQIGIRLQANTPYTCVEANPRLLECLTRNVNHNSKHLVNKIINGAVAYTADEVTFGVSDDNRVSSLGARRNAQNVSVPAVKLRDLIPAGPYQLVCDIEGAEAELISEDSSALDHCRLAIMELHSTQLDGQSVSVADLVHQFCRAGFNEIDRYGDVFVFGR